MYSKIKKRTEQENTVDVMVAVKDFLACAEVKRLRPSTQTEYNTNLPVFAQWCAEYALTQNKKTREWSAVKARAHHDCIQLHRVDNQVVSLFLEYIQETRTPSKKSDTELSSWTLIQYVKDIKRFLNWCIQDDQYCEHVNATAVARIQKPTLTQKIIEVFSEADIAALFKACDKEKYEHLQVRDRAIVALLLDSGVRATELCTLTIGDVHFDSKDCYARILGKGQRWDEVPIGQQARRAMQKYLSEFREPTIEYAVDQQLQHKNMTVREKTQAKKKAIQDARFFVSRTGQPMNRNSLLQLMHRLGEYAGIDEGVRCSPHTWRHTFAYYYMKNGGDIYTLSRLLRHKSVKTTEIYLRALRPRDIRHNARSVLDNL